MTEEVTKNQIKKERDAFLLAFLELDDLVENPNEVKKKRRVKQKKRSSIYEFK